MTACPGHETHPNTCTCACTGCQHNCAAHQPAGDTPMHVQPSPFLDSSGQHLSVKRTLAVAAEIIHSARKEWGNTYRRPGWLPAYHAPEHSPLHAAYTQEDALTTFLTSLKPEDKKHLATRGLDLTPPPPPPARPEVPSTLPPPPATPGNPLYELTALLPAKISNHLWGHNERIPMFPPMNYEDHGLAFATLGLDRHTLNYSFAWSIPSPADIAFIADHAPTAGIVEVGAGSGYWAWQLRQAGLTVHAYDLRPPGPKNSFAPVGPYSPVEYAGATASARHPECALLLCWPPYDKPMGYRALTAYTGEVVFMAGEGYGGCTGDDRMHEALSRDFIHVATSHGHPSWEGIHCSLEVWRRNRPATP